MIECKTCGHNFENDRENCWPCLEKEKNVLTKEDGYDDICYSCDYLRKELKDKTDTCSDCIFNIFKK